MPVKSFEVPRGASLNSFQTKIPQMAATTGAELLKPYDMAGLAAFTDIKLTVFPRPQIAPPSIPSRCVRGEPLKYSAKVTLSPSTGKIYINMGLYTNVLTNAPMENITTAVYEVSFPAFSGEKSVSSERATKL